MRIYVSMPVGETRDSFIPPKTAQRLEALGEVRWNPLARNLTQEELAEALGDAEVCVAGWGNAVFDGRLLDRAGSLKAVLYTGGSVAPIVNEETYARGIRVLSGNEIYAESVAESVIAYALYMLRDLGKYTREMAEYGWSREGAWNEGLIGQKVGLVGFGAVARYTARLLRVFRTETLICADHVNEAEAAQYGARKATLEQIFSECKVVSLHWARTPETYHGIDERLMRMLRPDSILINTARGAVVDEAAMARLLREKRFRAALDVYEEEPLPMDSPLRGLDNVMLIPHMGGPTVDRRPFVTEALIDELPEVMAGQPSWLDISAEQARRMTR